MLLFVYKFLLLSMILFLCVRLSVNFMIINLLIAWLKIIASLFQIVDLLMAQKISLNLIQLSE